MGLDANLYNPSGMYGLKAMDTEAPEYEYPGKPAGLPTRVSQARRVYQTEVRDGVNCPTEIAIYDT